MEFLKLMLMWLGAGVACIFVVGALDEVVEWFAKVNRTVKDINTNEYRWKFKNLENEIRVLKAEIKTLESRR